MAININAKTTGVGGLETSADNSGNINIQSGGSTVMSVTSSGVSVTGSFSQNGAVYSTQPSFRNLIINGDMRIDQRNAGSSVTPTNGAYSLDRMRQLLTQTGKYSVQQVTDAPDGFTNSLKVTSLSAYAVISSDYFLLNQHIEANNMSQLAWGTANAKTVTLSFWIKSSLTGTFGGAFSNTGATTSYPFSYTVSSANTWEKKTITIAGDTAGTWASGGNGIGIRVYFSLGTGTNHQNTAGSWYTANLLSSTGETSVVGTSGATWQITGVQLEVGSTATEFEHLPYDVELARCQRYCLIGPSGAAGRWNSTTSAEVAYGFPVDMRASPTVTHKTNYSASNLGLAGLSITATALSGTSHTRGTLLTLTSSGATTGGICGVRESGAIFSAEL